MATSVNGSGMAHARSLISAGKVNMTDSWSFSAEDGNKLLGPNGDNWDAYGQMHLAIHSDQPEKTKGHYGYPYGKGGEAYRSGIMAAKQRASQQNETDLSNACDSLMGMMENKQVQRAYSVLTIKSVHDELRVIEGIATTPTPDRYNDIVEPHGMEFKLPIPFLFQHKSNQPIGQVIEAKVSDAGIAVKVQIGKAGIAGYIDEAWSLIKNGLIRGLSVGFRAIETNYMKETDGLRFLKTEWLELSAVTIPAQSEATILAIKSADALVLAASGTEKRGIVRLDAKRLSPSVLGNSGTSQMTIREQINQFENKRAASVGQMDALMMKAGDEGRTLDGPESEQYDTLQTEVTGIDEHLKRLKLHEQAMIARATVVTTDGGSTPQKAADTRGGMNSVVTVSRNLPKGVSFARYLICLHQGGGNKAVAAEVAKEHCKDTPEVELVLRTEVATGTTTGTTWALPLMPAAATLYGEFLDMLRPATLIGRIPGLRYVPFRVNVPAQTGGATFGWVGETAAKPVSSMAFTTVSLDFHKIAGIVPVSKELLRFSNPSAEAVITNSMVMDTAQFMDSQFVDPAVHVSTGVHPGSITDQVVPKMSSGLTAAAFRADLSVVIKTFLTANDDPRAIVILMSPANTLEMSLIRNALGQKEFPDLTVNGGSLEGFPVIVSSAVGTRIVFVKASDILIAEGGVEIDMSQEASLVMTDDAGSSPLSTSMVSLFQRNMVAFRVEKFVTWKKGRTTSVAYIATSGQLYPG